MKTYNSTLIALIFIIGLSACSQRNTKHQELLNWLDSNEHTFSVDNQMSEDSAIIRVLTSVSDFNQQAGNSIKSDTNKVDAVEYLNQLEDFNNYLSQQNPITRQITLKQAQDFYDTHKNAQDTASRLPGCPQAILKDNTEAILFNLPILIAALDLIYHPGTNWTNPAFWNDKGFFMYPSNYGIIGSGSAASKNQTSVVLQFATDSLPNSADPDIWNVVPNQIYNLGDLKPPKIKISNPEHAPRPLIN